MFIDLTRNDQIFCIQMYLNSESVAWCQYEMRFPNGMACKLLLIISPMLWRELKGSVLYKFYLRFTCCFSLRIQLTVFKAAEKHFNRRSRVAIRARINDFESHTFHDSPGLSTRVIRGIIEEPNRILLPPGCFLIKDVFEIYQEKCHHIWVCVSMR